MRPQSLFPLFAPLSNLPGIGPANARLLAKLCGDKVVHLLWHLPIGLTDRRLAPKVAEAPAGQIATLLVQVEAHLAPSSPRRPWRVRCADETGFLHLIFFHAKPDWLARLLPIGTWRIVSGRVEHFNNEKQITHPDHIVSPEEIDTVQRIEPVYGLTTGLSAKVLHKAVEAALERVPVLPEWQEAAWLAQQRWPSWQEAVLAVHNPDGMVDLDPTAPVRSRLAYDELLAGQLALGLIRRTRRRKKGRVLQGDGALRQAARAALPFDLTAGQEAVLAEIATDMEAPAPMLRLLQGDVGSGKTILALLSMLQAVEAGTQAALMAPTEILARQHMASFEPILAKIGRRCALLTGRDRGRNREDKLAALADGTIDILLGTHALVQEEVQFKDLGLVVIDEQHRFGVEQRLSLAVKAQTRPDMLVMSATPIPRTLLLTGYGDLDVSRLTEKPPGRKPITTRALPLSRLDEVIAAVARALQTGNKVYWVCPLVEESEVMDLAAAEARYGELYQHFGARVGLVHGRMKAAEKDAVMAAFAGIDGDGQTVAPDAQLDVLVATTVIEVGVNVPEATVMIIDHAERFGLAQLHQLRGRVGRGERPGSCLLLYAPPLGETARARLQVLRETEDGFVIADTDLRLRGGGEVLGTRQSGLPSFRLAELTQHQGLLEAARDDVRLILDHDPTLEGERGQALRVLLYLFERDAAIRTLASG